MNLLMITADDLSFGSLGCTGCEFGDVSPAIDQLANTGISFNNAHTTIGLCQPSRSVWMTGLYPWNNGAMGFDPVFESVDTFVEILLKHNFTTGIVGKNSHLSPASKFPWHFSREGYCWDEGSEEHGKRPDFFLQACNDFFGSVTEPFFLMVNSHHPHRHFPLNVRFDASQVQLPPFLPDTPEVRQEMASYYEGVRRCDDIVSATLECLRSAPFADRTLVVFTSDHGMSFPFHKANCYHFSSRVPLIFNLPSLLEPKVLDGLTSSVDLMPTLLELLDVPLPKKIDGVSYLEMLQTSKPYRNFVYSSLLKNWSGHKLETRAVFSSEICYILNFWSNGFTEFVEEGSLDSHPSVQAIKTELPEIYRKLKFRSKEELYLIKSDPYAMNNRAAEERLSVLKNTARQLLLGCALASDDLFCLKRLGHMMS